MKLLKQVFVACLPALFLFSCNTESNDFETFGAGFDPKVAVLSADEMDDVFEKLEIGDTADIVFSTKIDAVCQKKGCWMDVELVDDYVARVTFLDYGFFVPLNSAGSEAIIKGKAFWKSDTAAEKRHYAEDAGEEFDESELAMADDYAPHIVATGVLLKK